MSSASTAAASTVSTGTLGSNPRSLFPSDSAATNEGLEDDLDHDKEDERKREEEDADFISKQLQGEAGDSDYVRRLKFELLGMVREDSALHKLKLAISDPDLKLAIDIGDSLDRVRTECPEYTIMLLDQSAYHFYLLYRTNTNMLLYITIYYI
jgi:hypothetical protein